MTDNLKIDLINGAYSQLRISGLTVMPSPSDIAVALRRLEALANELFIINTCIGYNFEDAPDANSTSGLVPSLWFAVESILAFRLMPDFGKGKAPDPILILNANAGFTLIFNYGVTVPITPYPSRQPVGSGNKLYKSKFYTPTETAPVVCGTNNMIVGDVSDFIEHFDAYLIDTEVITSFTIDVDTGLTLTSSSNTDTDVLYRITATGGSTNDASLKVKIVMTTDDGRITTRLIYFNLTTLETV